MEKRERIWGAVRPAGPEYLRADGTRRVCWGGMDEAPREDGRSTFRLGAPQLWGPPSGPCYSAVPTHALGCVPASGGLSWKTKSFLQARTKAPLLCAVAPNMGPGQMDTLSRAEPEVKSPDASL